MLSLAKPVRTTEGDLLFKQGDVLTGGCMYVVASGRYRATVQHGGRGGASRTRDYGPQDSFGASDLLCHDTGGERSCSVAVLRGGLVWAIPQRVIDLKLRIAPPSPISGLLEFCASCKLFATLSPERLAQLGRGAVERRVPAHGLVCEQRDAARAIYALMEGDLATTQDDSDFSLRLAPPATLGETALAADDELRVRSATVSAGGAGARVLVWEVAAIETLVGYTLQTATHALHSRQMLSAARCGPCSLAEGLDKDAMDTLLASMVELSFGERQPVVGEGEGDERLYLVKSGAASIQRLSDKRGGGSETLCVLQRGDCFGEIALLPPGHPLRVKRRTSVTAHGRAPLIALAISAHELAAICGEHAAAITAWRDGLTEQIGKYAIAGVDGVVLERLHSEGAAATLAALSKASQVVGQRKTQGSKKANKANKRAGGAPAAPSAAPDAAPTAAPTAAPAKSKQPTPDVVPAAGGAGGVPPRTVVRHHTPAGPPSGAASLMESPKKGRRRSSVSAVLRAAKKTGSAKGGGAAHRDKGGGAAHRDKGGGASGADTAVRAQA